MIITKDSGALKKGDKILNISNKTTDEILKELKELIPSENDYWIKYRAQCLLPSDIFLNKLGAIKDNGVKISVEHINGSKEDINLSFQDESVFNSSTLNTYEILKNKNIAVLRLNKLVNNQIYLDMLDNFFKDASENNIKTIAIDLRNCVGGDSSTVETFLSYLDIERYKPYQPGNVQYFFETPIKNKKNNNFSGNIYILTSNATISSGVIFAETLKVNKKGIIVGEPAGNAPSHCGAPVSICLPYDIGNISISTVYMVCPDKNKGDSFLKPDVYIPLTRKDIIEDVDPLINWLVDNNK